jgi:hydroxymethylglutaryl-CoA reductase (NADPH)
MVIPSLLIKQLYTFGSLKNIASGVQFSVKNRLTDTQVIGMKSIRIAGQNIPLDTVTMRLPDNTLILPTSITPDDPLSFPLRAILEITVPMNALMPGKYRVEIRFVVEKYGDLNLNVEDSISEGIPISNRIPRSEDDNYSLEIISQRQAFVEQFTGVKLQHLTKYTYDPEKTKGNIENFTGAAQVPIGFAGPVLINGEYAQGEFLVPLATTEGTLVASYNRGMKVLNLSGGVKCTVIGDCMQRAPVFGFDDARAARDFVKWVDENIDQIREEAEASSNVAKLLYIDPYLSNKFAFLRFNYTTGDAAGQNMVGRATFAASSWIIDHFPGIRQFLLESNFATDKKASQINIMRTRGKRVVAEATIKRDLLIQHMRAEPETLVHHGQVTNIGAIMSGANNNGLHSANAITAMFIATGQDVANVAESSAGIIFAELIGDGDLYISITIPSLIVATYGGGTGLATQRECLEILGCYGQGKVNKLAEIIAGVVLAGEISLAAAISSSDWVSSHEKYGRNR